MKIWLDDLRPMPATFDLHVKTVDECVALIKRGHVTHISFDHDLGQENGKLLPTGYDLAKWCEEWAQAGGYRFTWAVHSANPVGRANIEAAMRSADRFWTKVFPRTADKDYRTQR